MDLVEPLNFLKELQKIVLRKDKARLKDVVTQVNKVQ